MSRPLRTCGRVGLVAATFTALIWRLGTGPFLDGVRAVDGPALAAGAGLGLASAVCCAWRWKTVAAGLGVDLPLPTAVAAYYRSVFLNLTVPGGVVGDVHRGISHGRDVGDISRALRAVAWERFAGQIVQVALTVVVLLVLPSPVQSSMPLVVAGIAVIALVALLMSRVRRDRGSSGMARLGSMVSRDIRDGVLAQRRWVGIGLASVLVLASHVATFLIAAYTAGTTATPSRMLPIALLVMMAMVLPNVGGWGPREGVTAWAFGAAGLGAQQGVATAVTYGVVVFVASLPGAAVLLTAWFVRVRHPEAAAPRLREGAAHA